MVPVIGVEPIRYHYHRILSPARLPIPPHRHILFDTHYSIPQTNLKIKRFFWKFHNIFKLRKIAIALHILLWYNDKVDLLIRHFLWRVSFSKAARSIGKFKNWLADLCVNAEGVRFAKLHSDLSGTRDRSKMNSYLKRSRIFSAFLLYIFQHDFHLCRNVCPQTKTEIKSISAGGKVVERC